MESAWMLNYGTKKFLPHQMNSILVEAWDKFKVSTGNLIRERFVKKARPPQHSWLYRPHPGICCLRPSIFLIQCWGNKWDIRLHCCTYWGTRKQDRWYYGFTPIKGGPTIIWESCPTICSVKNFEERNHHPNSINEERTYRDTQSKESETVKLCKKY